MRKRFLSSGVFLILFLVTSVTIVVSQRPRNQGTSRAAAPSDLKIRYKTMMSGNPSESVTMIKGARDRSEMRMGYGMDTVNITQCDLKRIIQLSEKTKKYVITPMVGTESNAATTTTSATPTSREPVQRGGVVTYITTATDTGERKEMFGFTARHLKTTLTMKSSPDACNPVNQRIETDGWYIDFAVSFNCDLGRTQMMANRPTMPGGCQDRVVTRQEGTVKLGYPLVENVTMYGPDGNVMFTSLKEVLELSREPLDAALFDIPQGYVEAASSQELHGAPSMDSIMAQANEAQKDAQNDAAGTSSAVEAKQPGRLRVGVVTFTNKSDRSISLDALRGRLIGGIEAAGIDAVPLDALSQMEAESEARAKQCDFILYTDVSTLKLSAAKKLGGFLGRAAGVSGVDKSEARVDYRLFVVGESSPRLQSSASAKEEGEEASVGTALDTEAKAVSNEVRKKGRG